MKCFLKKILFLCVVSQLFLSCSSNKEVVKNTATNKEEVKHEAPKKKQIDPKLLVKKETKSVGVVKAKKSK